MFIALVIFFLLCVIGIVVGLFVPAARLIAIIAGSILLYLPSYFAWWFIIFLRYVDIDKLIAPYRWTEYGKTVEKLWFFGPPLIPSVILLLFCVGKYMYQRRRQS